MPQGKVKWFSEEKGFGFITTDDGSDLFVHRSEVQGNLPREDDTVEFEVGEGQKGPCAVKVTVVS